MSDNDTKSSAQHRSNMLVAQQLELIERGVVALEELAMSQQRLVKIQEEMLINLRMQKTTRDN